MSNRQAPPPKDRLQAELRAMQKRVARLEHGSTLRGVPACQRLRIGDVLITVDASAYPTLTVTAENLVTGTAPVVIATLP